MSYNVKYIHPAVLRFNIPNEMKLIINSFHQNSQGYTRDEIIKMKSIKESPNNVYKMNAIAVELHTFYLEGCLPSKIKNNGMYPRYLKMKNDITDGNSLYYSNLKRIELVSYKIAYRNGIIKKEALDEFHKRNNFTYE
jgi:hypothetical protein